jgi:uncharacterized phage infection (PIP) family protein YhgE
LATSQNRVEHAIASESEANTRLAEALRSGMGGVTASARTLAEMQSSLVGIRDEFRQIAQTNQEYASGLSRLLTEQTTIAAHIAKMARDMGANAPSAQEQQEMTQELSGLVRRLDTIAPAQQAAAGPGGFETVQTAEGGVRRVLTNAPDFMSDTVDTPTGTERGNRGRRD